MPVEMLFIAALGLVVAGFLFCSVSAYMAGLVGSSNHPVSGITISTILFAAVVLLLLMGPNATLGPVAAVVQRQRDVGGEVDQQDQDGAQAGGLGHRPKCDDNLIFPACPNLLEMAAAAFAHDALNDITFSVMKKF